VPHLLGSSSISFTIEAVDYLKKTIHSTTLVEANKTNDKLFPKVTEYYTLIKPINL
jgi:hypothetical protein